MEKLKNNYKFIAIAMGAFAIVISFINMFPYFTYNDGWEITFGILIQLAVAASGVLLIALNITKFTRKNFFGIVPIIVLAFILWCNYIYRIVYYATNDSTGWVSMIPYVLILPLAVLATSALAFIKQTKKISAAIALCIAVFYSLSLFNGSSYGLEYALIFFGAFGMLALYDSFEFKKPSDEASKDSNEVSEEPTTEEAVDEEVAPEEPTTEEAADEEVAPEEPTTEEAVDEEVAPLETPEEETELKEEKEA